jgi:SAM-dependent methyltransferase
VVQQHAQRTAEEAAAFLLPRLTPEMKLLDVGCGPGSITTGLAQHLTRGEVIGVDLGRETLERARRDAQERGIGNLRYEYADVYALPFPDDSFDVVYAHQVMQHLNERSQALVEMLRVLKPGGLIALRDVDWGTAVYWPRSPWLDRFLDVHQQACRWVGGEPQMGRELKSLILASGISDCETTAAVWCYATPAETIAWGDAYADRLLTSPMGERPIEAGLLTHSEVEAMADAFRTWAREPDAVWMFVHTAVLGRKPVS